MQNKKLLLIVSLACASALAIAPVTTAKKQAPPEKRDLLAREEMMVLNLDRGPKSAHFYILDSLKSARTIQKDLDRGQSQVEQVDASFAKARQRPDDRTMGTTVERFKQAQKTAQLLEEQLEACRDELKSDIKQTLIR